MSGLADLGDDPVAALVGEGNGGVQGQRRSGIAARHPTGRSTDLNVDLPLDQARIGVLVLDPDRELVGLVGFVPVDERG